MSNRLITISDLHISSTAPLDDFDREIEAHFENFLSEVATGTGAVELVINGDFLDFVQAQPYEGTALESQSRDEGLPLCFTEKQSLEKLDGIFKRHDGVFLALQNFLAANAANKIILIPGNHDADLFWTGVHTSLRQKIGGSHSGRVRIHLERVYRPTSFPGVWIEHGHQFDPINSFFVGQTEYWSAERPPIFTDKSGRQRLLECLGTRFLIRIINRLDRDYPYVDNVKPFSLFVRLFAASALVSGYASLQVAVTMWRLLYYLARTGLARPTDLLSADGEPLELNMALINRLREVNDQTKELQQRVHHEGFNPHVPLSLVLDDPILAEQLIEFLSEHADLLAGLDSQEHGYLSTSADEGTLSLARGFRIDETKELISGVSRIRTQNPEIKIVLMGHTHEPLDRPGGLPYLNTGSWTRYYQRSGSERLHPWSLLKAGNDNQFPCALKYAEVHRDAIDQAQLKEYPLK